MSQLLRTSLRPLGVPCARLHAARRWTHQHSKASKANETSPKPQETAQPISIPGPAWLWTTVQPLAKPFKAYDRASKNRPYVTQFISALVIYFLGDLSSQYIRQRGEHPEAPGKALVENYDTNRPLRALCIGGIACIPNYNWFIYLSMNFNSPASWPMSKLISLVYKVAINQALFTPVFNSYFFGMQSLLAGDGGPETLDSDATVWEALAVSDRLAAAWIRIRETVPTSWYNSCKFWPFVTAFSFTFIPLRQRGVFAGIMAIGWQSYLGILNQRAAEQERKELAIQEANM